MIYFTRTYLKMERGRTLAARIMTPYSSSKQANGRGATACAASSVAKVATGIGDGHEAVSSIAMVATGTHDERPASQPRATERPTNQSRHAGA